MQVTVDGCRLAFSVSGPEAAPPLLLLNALGTTTAVWAEQVAPFSRGLRVIRCDTRGHGDSAAPSGDYTLDQLGHDALAVLDAAGAARAHVCGVSLGGLLALWLARHAPERVDHIVCANTGARVGTRELWEQRIQAAREQGMAALAEPTMQRWFTEGSGSPRQRRWTDSGRWSPPVRSQAIPAAAPPCGTPICGTNSTASPPLPWSSPGRTIRRRRRSWARTSGTGSPAPAGWSWTRPISRTWSNRTPSTRPSSTS